MSKRLRTKLLFLFLIMLGLGIYDLFNPVLDENILVLYWLAIGLVLLLWLYYAILVPRASVQVRPKSLRLQGPLFGFNISYGRIYSVTSAQMSQHFPFESLKGSERSVLKPLYNRTCVFVELTGYPKSFRWRNLWFPKHIFGTSRTGLLCVIDDWLSLSRDLEAYRGNRYERVHNSDRGESRSLAARVLTSD